MSTHAGPARSAESDQRRLTVALRHLRGLAQRSLIITAQEESLWSLADQEDLEMTMHTMRQIATITSDELQRRLRALQGEPIAGRSPLWETESRDPS